MVKHGSVHKDILVRYFIFQSLKTLGFHKKDRRKQIFNVRKPGYAMWLLNKVPFV